MRTQVPMEVRGVGAGDTCRFGLPDLGDGI